MTIVRVATMISISVSGEQFIGVGVRGIGWYKVKGTLNISNEMLDSCPMGFTRIGVELTEDSHRIEYVWSGRNCKPHECTNCIDIRYLGHFLFFLRGRG